MCCSFVRKSALASSTVSICHTAVPGIVRQDKMRNPKQHFYCHRSRASSQESQTESRKPRTLAAPGVHDRSSPCEFTDKVFISTPEDTLSSNPPRKLPYKSQPRTGHSSPRATSA